MASSAKAPHSAHGHPSDNLVTCKFCKRHFNSDRIRKHEEICEKIIHKNRKVYDMAKHRAKGTDLEIYLAYVKKISNKPATAKVLVVSSGHPAKKSDWRRRHEEFISAIQAAKKMKIHLARGGKLSDLPPPPPSTNPDYVECPHCHRRFNEAAANRHIPKCATYEHNKPKPVTRTTTRGPSCKPRTNFYSKKENK